MSSRCLWGTTCQGPCWRQLRASGAEVWSVASCQRAESCLWPVLARCLQGTNLGEIFRWYGEVVLKNPQIEMKFIQCTKGERGSNFFCHLFNSGELFATSCSCISNSKQREIIFNADRKGGTCVGKLTCSPVSYSKIFPIIKQGWHIRQILDRLAALFILLRCTVIHLWSLPCGNCLFIENWIYFEMLMIGYIF